MTLTDHGIMLFDTSLQYAYDDSLKYTVSNKASLKSLFYLLIASFNCSSLTDEVLLTPVMLLLDKRGQEILANNLMNETGEGNNQRGWRSG